MALRGLCCYRGLPLIAETGGCSLGVGFSICGMQAYLLHGMKNLPGLGTEPVSPALAGKFLSTIPLAKTCFLIYIFSLWASLVAQKVKNPPTMQETWVRSLGQEDPLEKGMATHSSILAWRIPGTEEPSEL